MKIRLGFVSNSSSASFICRHCASEYEVECRGGTDDEWVAPVDGLCEECQKHVFICTCHNIFPKEVSHKLCEDNETFDEGIEVAGEYIGSFSNHICPACFAKNERNQLADHIKKWSKKISDPGYKPTEIDKKIIEEMNKFT